MALYVCFDDSNSDPTYAGADAAYIVESNAIDGNPCSFDNAERTVRAIPRTAIEIEEFAAVMGWSVGIENGCIVIHTDVPV